MSKSKPQDKLYHYVYKIIIAGSKKYYIGRHSTDNIDFLNDGYWGSGKWSKSIKDKSRLTKIILGVYDTYEELLVAEEELILEHIDDKPNCMNVIVSSCGAAPGQYAGDKNPMYGKTGELHPMHGRTGELHPSYGKKRSKEHRQKMSERVSGELHPMYGKTGELHPMYGRKHSGETKQKQSVAAKNRSPISEETRQKISDAKKGKYIGEKCHKAKLTENLVLEILEKYAAGGTSYQKLAEEYGVTVGCTSAIITKKSWKHI